MTAGTGVTYHGYGCGDPPCAIDYILTRGFTCESVEDEVQTVLPVGHRHLLVLQGLAAAAADTQETPKAPVKKDTGKEPLTPSFSIPNPAMFYP